MENQNILTIKFNTLDDLAVQVEDWNERLNHQYCGNCSDTEVPTATVGKTIDVEVEAPVVEEKADTKPQPQPEPVEVVPVQEDVPVTDFEGKLTKAKKEEKVEPVVEPKPAETTKVEESTPVESTQQDTELDVVAEPVDKKAFYKEFREWMGEDGVKAKKALAIFSKHGVTRPSSDSLTDDLITDLKSIMAEEA